MHIIHKWKYVGHIYVWRWLGGVAGGIPYETMIKAKKCTVPGCEKIKEI